MLMECLSVGRGITLPSNSTGGMKSIALATGAYAHLRRQFKISIGKMEGIEEPLARIAGNTYVMDAAATLVTVGIMQGAKPAVFSAIVKYHCTHRAQRAALDAMDITGGKGICLGPSNFVARSYQGSPIAITVEGANILTRSMIIFGQGAIRCHSYVLKEVAAAQDDNLTSFDRALFGHIGHVGSNLARSLWLGLSNGHLSHAPTKDATRHYYQRMNRLSANLALLADVSMAVLGGDLKRRERIFARLGDVLSQLYLASATLKRFDDEGRQQANLLRNFPNRAVAAIMHIALFPLGQVSPAPSDRLDHQVAKLLQTPSATRSRLGRGQYLTASEHNPVGLLEQSLLEVMAAEPIHQRLSKALGKSLPFMRLDQLAEQALAEGDITAEEAQILIRAEASRLRAINVDDFAPGALAAQAPQAKPATKKSVAVA